MSSPVQPTQFDVKKVSVSAPKVLGGGTGAKMAYLNYGNGGGNSSLMLQTPSLPSPFGLNLFQDKSGGAAKYSINLAMRGYLENPKVKAFYAALTQLDEFMVDEAVKNSKTWFKGDMSREVVKAFYTPCVKFGRDKEGNLRPYPPDIKITLRKQRNSEEFECNFYDAKSAQDPHAKPLRGIPIEEMLPRRVELTGLIECSGVWFAGGKFGLTWKASQFRIDRLPAGPVGYSIQNDPADAEEFSSPAARPADDEDEDDEEAAPAPATTRGAPKTQTQTQEPVDSDDEVAPAPLPKASVITKAKVVKRVAK